MMTKTKIGDLERCTHECSFYLQNGRNGRCSLLKAPGDEMETGSQCLVRAKGQQELQALSQYQHRQAVDYQQSAAIRFHAALVLMEVAGEQPKRPVPACLRDWEKHFNIGDVVYGFMPKERRWSTGVVREEYRSPHDGMVAWTENGGLVCCGVESLVLLDWELRHFLDNSGEFAGWMVDSRFSFPLVDSPETILSKAREAVDQGPDTDIQA